jgi:hypothetical protein
MGRKIMLDIRFREYIIDPAEGLMTIKNSNRQESILRTLQQAIRRLSNRLPHILSEGVQSKAVSQNTPEVRQYDIWTKQTFYWIPKNRVEGSSRYHLDAYRLGRAICVLPNKLALKTQGFLRYLLSSWVKDIKNTNYHINLCWLRPEKGGVSLESN